jgi:hypothetical protein
MLAQSWGQRKVGPSPLGSFGSFGRPVTLTTAPGALKCGRSSQAATQLGVAVEALKTLDDADDALPDGRARTPSRIARPTTATPIDRIATPARRTT